MRIKEKAFESGGGAGKLKSRLLLLANFGARRRIPVRIASIACGVAPLLVVLQLFLFSAMAIAGPTLQDQKEEEKRQPVGSLTTAGEVYVNDKAAPAETTVFAGDTLRTGETGTAIFTVSGNGTLKIGSSSQIVITEDPKFTAELQSGTAVIDSISGPSGVKLRAGSAVVVPAVRSRVTAARVERQADGSFLVTCLDGDISTIPLQGTSGQLLEAGQSVTVSQGGELVAQKGAGGVKSAGSGQHGGLNRTGWTLLGVAGAGAGIGAAALGHGGGKQSVSPSKP